MFQPLPFPQGQGAFAEDDFSRTEGLETHRRAARPALLLAAAAEVLAFAAVKIFLQNPVGPHGPEDRLPVSERGDLLTHHGTAANPPQCFHPGRWQRR